MAFSVIDCLFSPEGGSSGSGAQIAACGENSASLLSRMDAAGIGRVLLSPCKRWKCERHWICGEIQVDEVLQYVNAAPQRFAALASYNPFAITESLQQIERAIKVQDVRGIYVPTEGSDVALDDRRMYPLYARATALTKPVMIDLSASAEFGAEALARVAREFAELTVVAAWPGAIDVAAARALVSQASNVYAAFDIRRAGQDAIEWLQRDGVASQCLWGSNGFSWNDLPQAFAKLSLDEATAQKYFQDSAVKVFELGRASAKPLPQGIDIAVAER